MKIEKTANELDELLKDDVEMVVNHSTYQVIERMDARECAEVWAFEIIDLIEIRVTDPDCRKFAAKRVLESLENIPVLAKTSVRKYFDLWT